jgi:hypothetical protein
MSQAKDDDRNSAPDEVRRKFAEALARKQGKHDEHDMGRRESTGQAHTGPAKQQRQFRRKSGG